MDKKSTIKFYDQMLQGTGGDAVSCGTDGGLVASLLCGDILIIVLFISQFINLINNCLKLHKRTYELKYFSHTHK